MNEAKTRHVDWSDVDEDTFIRLCEYAYRSDYTPPDCLVSLETMKKTFIKKKSKKKRALLNASPVDDQSLLQPPQDAEPPPTTEEPPPVNEEELPYKEKSIRMQYLRDSFSRLNLDFGPRHKPAKDCFSPKPNTQDQDFTPVFLGHARLYVLADKYGIESLCQMVLSKVAQTLEIFTLYHRSVTTVIEFVRFVYSDGFRYVHGIGALRSLVTSYIASTLGQLGDDERFERLLEDGGDFIVDFWRAIWNTDGV